ncbi:MAG TPA: hydrogenase maturation nickel metallochaperone HypA [Kofleriaceae bacterium]
MHELGIALEIVDLAAQRAGGAEILRIVVEVGALTMVLPDALAFAWEVATEDSPVAGAKLEIVTIAGRGKCRLCGTEQELSAPFGRCVCGTMDLELVAGEELRIRELEVNHVRDLRVLGDRR